MLSHTSSPEPLGTGSKRYPPLCGALWWVAGLPWPQQTRSPHSWRGRPSHFFPGLHRCNCQLSACYKHIIVICSNLAGTIVYNGHRPYQQSEQQSIQFKIPQSPTLNERNLTATSPTQRNKRRHLISTWNLFLELTVLRRMINYDETQATLMHNSWGFSING